MNTDFITKKIRSFLVRCWQEEASDPGGVPTWRFTLTELDPKQARKGFKSLELLFDYLREELAKTVENNH